MDAINTVGIAALGSNLCINSGKLRC